MFSPCSEGMARLGRARTVEQKLAALVAPAAATQAQVQPPFKVRGTSGQRISRTLTTTRDGSDNGSRRELVFKKCAIAMPSEISRSPTRSSVFLLFAAPPARPRKASLYLRRAQVRFPPSRSPAGALPVSPSPPEQDMVVGPSQTGRHTDFLARRSLRRRPLWGVFVVTRRLHGQRRARSTPHRWPRLFFNDTAPGRRLWLRNDVTEAF